MTTSELIQRGGKIGDKLDLLHRRFEANKAGTEDDLLLTDGERANKLSACRKVITDNLPEAEAFIEEASARLDEIGPKTAPAPSGDKLVRFRVLATFFLLSPDERVSTFRDAVDKGGADAATLIDIVDNVHNNLHPSQMNWPSAMGWLGKLVPEDELQRGLGRWAIKYPKHPSADYQELASTFHRINNRAVDLRLCASNGQPA